MPHATQLQLGTSPPPSCRHRRQLILLCWVHVLFYGLCAWHVPYPRLEVCQGVQQCRDFSPGLLLHDSTAYMTLDTLRNPYVLNHGLYVAVCMHKAEQGGTPAASPHTPDTASHSLHDPGDPTLHAAPLRRLCAYNQPPHAARFIPIYTSIYIPRPMDPVRRPLVSLLSPLTPTHTTRRCCPSNSNQGRIPQSTCCSANSLEKRGTFWHLQTFSTYTLQITCTPSHHRNKIDNCAMRNYYLFDFCQEQQLPSVQPEAALQANPVAAHRPLTQPPQRLANVRWLLSVHQSAHGCGQRPQPP